MHMTHDRAFFSFWGGGGGGVILCLRMHIHAHVIISICNTYFRGLGSASVISEQTHPTLARKGNPPKLIERLQAYTGEKMTLLGSIKVTVA